MLRKVDNLVAKDGNHEATLLERVRSKYALLSVPGWAAIRARWAGDTHASAHDIVAAIVIQAHVRAAWARRTVAALHSETLDRALCSTRKVLRASRVPAGAKVTSR